MKSRLISAEDIELISLVNSAKYQIAFLGTALSNKLADAMIAKREILKFVYLDIDELCYRNGYGEAGSIKMLKDAGIQLYELPKIRINILVIDDEAVVFSPLPLSIEEEAREQNATGILISYDAIEDVIASSAPIDDVAPPVEKNELVKNETKIIQVIKTNTGLVQPKEITDDKIEALNESIKRNPILEFSTTRFVNTYSNYIGFIEIKAIGFSLNRHTIKIPKDILNASNKDTKGTLNASYSLMDVAFDEVQSLQKEIENFRLRYSFPIANFGSVYIKSEALEIDLKKAELEDKICNLNKNVMKQIENRYNVAIAEVVEKILPLLPRDYFSHSKAFRGMDFSNAEVREQFLREKIQQANRDNKPDNIHFELKVIMKDVTYSMINDKDFINKLLTYPKLKKLCEEKGFFTEQIVTETRVKN